MIWLYLALLAYLINAVAFIVDKYLLAAPIPRPFAYAFWVALLSSFALVLIPFGVLWYGSFYFFVSFISGLAFFLGLIMLYRAIKISDISVASTKVGAFGAIFTAVFFISFSQGYDDTITWSRIVSLDFGSIFLSSG